MSNTDADKDFVKAQDIYILIQHKLAAMHQDSFFVSICYFICQVHF